ncbi:MULTISPECIES: acetolactate synthase large subunit [unclassified Sphingomonas]|jgi:acetolactate synthase I/II/III large subunit|uniref:acetolactate synthase large subunit n=1 Tax=unclassified Sphingomonas TaxID=196159 RepID=UPI000DB12FA7|nr:MULTISPECIES: acetolactate synthase large subunit [unclassified Sphingomonas]MDE0877443.1 acetolactate synthase large subunit [Sphingomonas bacterium]PZT90431.1 MAG: acetolactate synthase large subunit [Sphingomonas sp.]PZU68489.1 MAG: acetolactate synthase large subunit [Rhizobium sp.]RSV29425.1 acetolactate synthase large subunit [Sphingomonas sp. ABOLH]
MGKGSDMFVAALENEGVDRVFGVPGEENLDLLESLRTSSIELVLTRHEQAAAFMAATYGRLTGKPGVCLATLGPGALNLSTGAAYAHLGAMPMILITGQKPLMNGKQARFQIVDIVASMKPLTKMTRQIVSAASIPAMVRDAFRVATEERPGPVHLELPEDVAAEEVEDIPVIFPHALQPPVASAASLDIAAKAILAARRPLVMVGAAGNRPALVEALSDFIARTRLPFFNTQMGKGAVAGGSDRYMGTAALSEGDYVHEAVERADLIIAIGHDTIEKPPFLMKSAGGSQVIHIGYQSATVEQVYHPDIEVIGDIGATVAGLAERLAGRLTGDQGMLDLRQNILARINDRSDESRFPITPQRIVHDVRAVMPEDGIVCLDNGMYKIWFARNYRTHVANTLLLDNALATMGAGLPSAMMAAMLYPARRVMAVCGDGGFMMNSQEMETAVRLGLNLVVVILNDSAYGMIRWKQAVEGFPDFGMSFGNPDFVRYAEAYGAKGSRVTAVEDLVPVLEAAFTGGGVHLVEVPIDYSENTRVLVEELRNRAPNVECT